MAVLRTVVVIEDEDSIAAVEARLVSEGFRVEIASDGVAGVELCEKVRPDLVVLDLMLPGARRPRGLSADPPGPTVAGSDADGP